MGDELAGFMNGSTVVEIIFGWPGIGKLLIDAINAITKTAAVTTGKSLRGDSQCLKPSCQQKPDCNTDYGDDYHAGQRNPDAEIQDFAVGLYQVAAGEPDCKSAKLTAGIVYLPVFPVTCFGVT